MARYRLALLSALLLLAGATACGDDDSAATEDGEGTTSTAAEQVNSAEDNEDVEPIDVTYVPSSPGLATLDLWVARYGGHFEDAGLNIQWEAATNDGALAVTAALSGDADLVSGAVANVATVADQGRDAGMFAVSAHGASTHILTISTDAAAELAEAGITPDSPIEDRLQGLSGLTIGVSGAVGPLLETAVESVGVEPGAVSLQNMDLATMPGSLRAGQIDGYMITPPHSVIPEVEGYGTVWMCAPCGDVDALGEGVYTVYITSAAVRDSEPEMIRRFVAGLESATDFIASNDAATIADVISEQYPDLEHEVLVRSVEVMMGAFKGPMVDEQQVQQGIDIYNEQTETPVSVTAADIWWGGEIADG